MGKRDSKKEINIELQHAIEIEIVYNNTEFMVGVASRRSLDQPSRSLIMRAYAVNHLFQPLQ
jgi:hypothetical protein